MPWISALSWRPAVSAGLSEFREISLKAVLVVVGAVGALGRVGDAGTADEIAEVGGGLPTARGEFPSSASFEPN